jgi:hypothetical protein
LFQGITPLKPQLVFTAAVYRGLGSQLRPKTNRSP